MIDAMDAQRLKPPRLQILQENDYWEEMDAVLQAELDVAELEQQPKVSKQSMVLYAAVLLLTVLWGWHHRQRAIHLERIVYTQQQTLEQLERVSTPVYTIKDRRMLMSKSLIDQPKWSCNVACFE